MKRRIIILSIFLGTFISFLTLLIISFVNTNNYNQNIYNLEVSDSNLFKTTPDKTKDVSVNITTRAGESWGKPFDLYNEGITENNYTAHTYDVYVSNNTNSQLNKFSFKLTFNHEAFLSKAWNGGVEVHQNKNGVEKTALINDLRTYNPSDYDLNYYFLQGEPFIEFQSGDYLIYYPSESLNALELPIRAHEGATPGFIIYVKDGEDIKNSSVTLTYTLHKLVFSDILFGISFIGFLLWIIALIVTIILVHQITKYKIRHLRDKKIIDESIETFTGFIDAKDAYTNGHSKRVAIYTRLIAEEMGYSGEELDRIYYIALLHDCGKIGVPDNILRKPGRLTDEEFEIIKSHTTRGGEILSNFKSIENAGEGALYHHERYDGKGYPKGLAGDDIPLIARIICVADSFDAMNSSRVYRKNLSKEYIINELEKNKGTQFDPNIAEIMLNLIKSGKVKIEE